MPKELQDELAQAQRRDRRKRATRFVHVGDEAFAILEYSDHGFAVDSEEAPRLRGLIDIFDGPRHLYQALIVASEEDGDLMRYEFKRNTAASATAPVDFERSATAPAGLLPSS
ncbi:hypothetical protein GCM10023209_34310 [Roseibacterium beibuensis]|uniref:Uncharacterized protein n=1 Tax=[Roseibacterium] beibuensis TaxID=1193142 RepID=A0ABP9LKW2_9RHOB